MRDCCLALSLMELVKVLFSSSLDLVLIKVVSLDLLTSPLTFPNSLIWAEFYLDCRAGIYDGYRFLTLGIIYVTVLFPAFYFVYIFGIASISLIKFYFSETWFKFYLPLTWNPLMNLGVFFLIPGL
jgi:hypothetical protein